MSSIYHTGKPTNKTKPMTAPRFREAKSKGEKLSVLTAYDYAMALLLDQAGVDAILVGDTLGMVVQGNDTTLSVTVDEMIYHTRMVCRAVKSALVIADMPFMSYQESPQVALSNAGKIIKESGASAVKLEGGTHQAETIKKITTAGIPVMGHVGLRPQSVRELGGLNKIQRDEKSLLEDAHAAEQAGAFAIVLELIPQQIAAKITAAVSIPTIGIGAGPHCDGQVLVINDMLGMTENFSPKFLKKYLDLAPMIKDATTAFIEEVKTGTFPSADHSHD